MANLPIALKGQEEDHCSNGVHMPSCGGVR